jgi:hypothetical protein
MSRLVLKFPHIRVDHLYIKSQHVSETIHHDLPPPEQFFSQQKIKIKLSARSDCYNLVNRQVLAEYV